MPDTTLTERIEQLLGQVGGEQRVIQVASDSGGWEFGRTTSLPTPEPTPEPEPESMALPRYCDGCGECFDYQIEGGYCECLYYNCDDCSPCTCSSYDSDDDDDERDRYGIHSWDWRPHRFNSKGNYPQEVLMGVELEVGESKQSIANAVHSVDSPEYHLYLKHDSSICGAEIVTHPMTLRWAREWVTDGGGAFPKFELLLRQLRLAGCHTNENYGLHIHVSRNAFKVGPRKERSASHQMTWLLFIYRNAGYLEHLARRDPEEWGAFSAPGRGELKHKAEQVATRYPRYVAVNCNNEKTYELRFFAATLDDTEFWAALEFADAGVEYTRHLKAADILKGGALQWKSFVKWVNQHDYPNLSIEFRNQAINH